MTTITTEMNSTIPLRIREDTFQDALWQMSRWPTTVRTLGQTYFQENKERLMTLDAKCFQELHALLKVPEDAFCAMNLGVPDKRNPDGYFYAKFYLLSYPVLNMCEDCQRYSAEHDFVRVEDGKSLRLCSECYEEALENAERCLCEECEIDIAAHDFEGAENKVYHLCGVCYKDAVVTAEEGMRWEEQRQKAEEQEEHLGHCESCQTEQATIVFMHLSNGNFELCQRCFEFADHERDYGKDFGK